MKELLEWIAEQGYVLHSDKDKGWYKRGLYRPWRPTIYYTHNELIELYGIEEQKEKVKK